MWRKIIICCLLTLFYFDDRRYPQINIETQYLFPRAELTL